MSAEVAIAYTEAIIGHTLPGTDCTEANGINIEIGIAPTECEKDRMEAVKSHMKDGIS